MTSTQESPADESEVNDDIANDRLWGGGWILLVHIILPIAITGLIVGRKTIFNKFLTHFDKLCISVICPSLSKREKLRKWMTAYLPFIGGVKGVASIWEDGSLMCTLINTVVPGACLNPHRHWRKPPIHGQALAYKYLGITPVFSEKDFELTQPTAAMENRLVEYMSELQQAMDKIAPKPDGLGFSTRYIARGMGLVTGEQHRRIVFYVYSNNTDHTDDLLINIRGPYNTFGCITLNSRQFSDDMANHLPEKRPSFLNTLSTDFSKLLKSKKGPPRSSDIEIREEFEKERVKVTFVPINSGVYEICLITNGEHISGSPFNLTVEKNHSGITEDLNSKNVKRKVIDAINYYENMKKPRDATKELKEICDKDDDKDDGNVEMQTVPVTLPTLTPNEPAKLKVEKIAFIDIVETMQLISNENVLKESEPSVTSSHQPTENIAECSNQDEEAKVNVAKRENFGLNIIETMRDITELTTAGNQVSKLSTSYDSGQSKMLNDFTADSCAILPSKEIQEIPLENVNNKLQTATATTLEDSGASLNEDIDPDSLSTSIETHESFEELCASTGSEANFHSEVNNNDVMVKSNEDICYLILNQSNKHKRIYSKDFISCSDDKRKHDLSRSDPNLHNPNTDESDSPPINVSALSQDNVQEACASSLQLHHQRHERQTSRILPSQHPQEGHIACTRSHSYSYGSLIEPKLNHPKSEEFRENFMRRKAFWTNMSKSNVALNITRNGSIGMDNNSEHRRLQTTRVMAKAESRRKIYAKEGYKARSLEFVRQNAKVEPKLDLQQFAFISNETVYGSVDDLNFPSVKDRRELFVREEQDVKSPDRQGLYAVRGDKCSRSIHETIKYFETQQNAAQRTPLQRQDSVQRNKNISKRYERAATYFKRLETNSTRVNHQVRRHSFDLDNEVKVAMKYASLRHLPNGQKDGGSLDDNCKSTDNDFSIKRCTETNNNSTSARCMKRKHERAKNE